MNRSATNKAASQRGSAKALPTFILPFFLIAGLLLLGDVAQAQYTPPDGSSTRDYGDAPDSYQTLIASGGASQYWHPTRNLILGVLSDDELDGMPAANMGDPANGDGSDDESITFDESSSNAFPTIPATPGINFDIQVFMCNLFNQAGEVGYTACWIDFNRNGTFEASERATQTVAPTVAAYQPVNFTTPVGIQEGITYIRCRTSMTETDTDNPYGPGVDWGEVEDFDITIDGPLPVELARFTLTPDGGRGALLEWETLSEDNNAGFEVEVNWNRQGFQQIGFVNGHGTTDEPKTYQFQVANLSPGIHQFRLKQVDFDGAYTYSPLVETEVDLPGDFLLEPAYPNPFNPSTNLRFTIAEREPVKVVLYDALGHWKQVLYEGTPEAGITKEVRVEAAGLSTGIYIVRLEGRTFRASQKITLIK